eukprot:Awhi_evm1s5870
MLSVDFATSRFGTYDDTLMTYASSEYRYNLHKALKDNTERYKFSPLGGEIGYGFTTTRFYKEEGQVVSVRAMAFMGNTQNYMGVEAPKTDINYDPSLLFLAELCGIPVALARR